MLLDDPPASNFWPIKGKLVSNSLVSQCRAISLNWMKARAREPSGVRYRARFSCSLCTGGWWRGSGLSHSFGRLLGRTEEEVAHTTAFGGRRRRLNNSRSRWWRCICLVLCYYVRITANLESESDLKLGSLNPTEGHWVLVKISEEIRVSYSSNSCSIRQFGSSRHSGVVTK